MKGNVTMKEMTQKARELYTSIGVSLEEEPKIKIEPALTADFILDEEQKRSLRKIPSNYFMV